MTKGVRRGAKNALIESLSAMVATGLDKAVRSPAELATLRPRKVLLVRTDRIGDVLCGTPLMAALRRIWPDAEMVLLGGARSRVVTGLLPDIARAPVEFARHPGAWAEITRWVPRQQFDVVVSLRPEFFSGAWVAALSGAPVRVTLTAAPTLPAFNTVLVGDEEHMVRKSWRAAAALGVVLPEVRPVVVLPPEAEKAAAHAWADLELEQSAWVVGVAVPNRSGSRHQPRALSEATLVRLCEILRRESVAVVLFGYGSEAAEARRIAGAVSGTRVAPVLDLAGLGALLRRISVYVSGYTGPLHLADAVGTGTVSVGIPAHVACFRPLGERHRVISAVRVSAVTAEDLCGEVRSLLGAGVGIRRPGS